MRRVSRVDDSLFSRWWWSIDRPLIALIAPLILIGAVALVVASPGATDRLRINDEFYFASRQLLFMGPAVIVMLAVTLLTPLQARRFGVLLFVGASVLMILALAFSPKINGATRWIDLGVMTLQPSEFAKPGFVILAAWMMAEGARNRLFPGGQIALCLYLATSALLLMQPDFGQWMLLTAVWAAMFFIAGWSWLWIGALGLAASGALVVGYYASDHVARRIDGFLHPEKTDTYQVDYALETISNGGVFGRGDADTVRGYLPDAHTDFVFAAVTEEFGLAIGLVIIAIFAVFVLRALIVAARSKSVFSQCAVAGLASLIGFQAMINIGVSLRALPAKGMTLPFISYGGSSLLATGLTIGLIIALTRTYGGALRRKEIMP